MPTWNTLHVYLALIYSLEWGKIKLFVDNTSSDAYLIATQIWSFLILWKSVLYIPDILLSSCNCSPFVFQCTKAVYFNLFWLYWGCLLLTFYVSIKLLLFLLEKQLSIFKLDALAGWVIALYFVRLWNPAVELKQLKSLFRKEVIISYCLLEKLLACSCRWPAKDLRKKNWILSSFFLVLR